MSYYTSWVDFGNPMQTSILKKITMTLVGATNQEVVYKWGFDYATSQYSQSVTLGGTNSVSEYNDAEYGIGEYNLNTYVASFSVPASGSGKVIQVGIEARLQGLPISVQRVDIQTKDGRL
jgi:hypothetical protein